MRCLAIRALIALLVMSAATPAVRGQNELPQRDAPQSDADVDAEPVPPTSVLDASKTDEIIDLLSASYAADLAMHIAIKTAECTAAEPRCAPLFFAQDVIRGPWNFIKLLRVTQEQADQEWRSSSLATIRRQIFQQPACDRRRWCRSPNTRWSSRSRCTSSSKPGKSRSSG